MPRDEAFLQPSVVERLFNRVFGVLAGLGIGLEHNYRLTVRGRNSGRHYRTPVNLLRIDGREYLVAPRGKTGWVKNVRANRELQLTRGSDDAVYSAEEVPIADRVPILREYLARYTKTVQRYFTVDPASSDDEYANVARLHPVFELKRLDGANPPVKATP
tara:strand:+ start:5555 stop:6034 length:480 start_codon:yes stop_codon:yes gene_type:complete